MYHNTYPYASYFFHDRHQQTREISRHYHQKESILPSTTITSRKKQIKANTSSAIPYKEITSLSIP